MNTSRAWRNCLCSRRHRGQVIMITLFAILLLAGMVFYVFNLGDQVNRRVSMQNAADSAAIGGATWMARSMNVVAMNNVAQTRLITMVAILDSLPLATQMSYEEINEWLRGLDQQMAIGIPDQYLDQGMRSLTRRFHEEQDRLEPLYQLLVSSGYDVRPLTFWRLDGVAGDVPHGTLWVGTKALEYFNRATVESAGRLCQATGSRMGTACIVRDPDAYPISQGYGSAFIVPVLPELPARLGDFMDFRQPVMAGRPPEYVQGTVADQIRRGPYDQLFHWRTAVYDMSRHVLVNRTFVAGSAGPMRNADPHGIGGKDIGKSVVGGPQDRWVGQYRSIPGPQIGWNAYGVYQWALYDQVRDSGLAHYCEGYTSRFNTRGNLSDTNFLAMLRTLSKAKLDYIWGDTSVKRIHHPKWISLYPEAREFVGDPLPATQPADPDAPPQPAQQPRAPQANPPQANQVKYTMFYMVQTKSSIAPDDPGFRTPGTFVTNSDDPKAIWVKGWVDPALWERDPVKKAVKIADYVWQVDWDYETTFDESIGLRRQNLAPGQEPEWKKVYIREQYVFGGADIGPDINIRNPANWSSGDEKPRPYLIDLAKAEYRSERTDDYLSFLGVARQTTRAAFWPDRFTSGNPYPNVLAVAEAHVFNNQSWDLWTQDWQARLRPIGSWDYWVNRRMNANPADLEVVRRYVNEEDLMRIRTVLQSYDPTIVEQLKTH